MHGPRLLRSVLVVPREEAIEHDTYSIVTEGGNADLIAVGDLLAHATDKEKHDLFMTHDAKMSKEPRKKQEKESKKSKKTKSSTKLPWLK